MVWRNAVDIQGKNLRADSWMGKYFCQFESKSKVVNFVKIAIKKWPPVADQEADVLTVSPT